MEGQNSGICRFAFAIAILALIALVSVPTYAQVFTGSISGNVADSGGATIPAANLTLTRTKTGLLIKASSGESGSFVFPSVEPGDYTLKIEKDGFKTLEKTGITLQTGERLALGTIGLSVGAVAQTVTVTGAEAVVDTETAARVGYIDSEQVETQLLFGRNAATLATLLPGVSGGNASSSLDRSGAQFSSQGGRTDQNNFSVDGINSTDIDNGFDIKMQQSVDAMSEVTVLQNNYQAEYANGAGAMVIQVTKSGTKEFHGGVNYYSKNEFFDANSYFNKLNGQRRNKDRIYNVNYSVGGPVPLGKWNQSRDKLFFFWNQEFWPSSNSATYRITVPTDLERSGDFSQSYQTDGVTLRIIKDPTTGLPFPGNKIPANRLDPNGQAILKLLPKANFFNSAVSKNQYDCVGSGVYNTPNETRTLRVDYNKSSNDRFSVTWTGFHEDTDGFHGVAAWFGGFSYPFLDAKFTANNNGLAGRWTHTISTATVNEAAFSWQTNPEKAISLDAKAPLQSTYGLSLPMLSSKGNPLDYVPGLNFDGVPNGASIGNNGGGYFWLPYNAPNNVYNWTDKLSSLHGTHFVKMGVEVMRFWRDIPGNSVRFGNYEFSTNSLNPLDTNYDFSNAILGIYNYYTETNGIPVQKARGGNYNVFVQDTWRVVPRLSLDYGLRFEYLIPVYQGDNAWAAFYPSAYDPSKAVQLYQPGTNGSGQRVAVNPITGAQYPAALIGAIVPGSGLAFNGMVSPALGTGPTRAATDQRGVEVAPRLGFSWDIFGDHKTALRGGAGVFTSMPPLAQYRSRVGQPPVLETPQVFYGTITNLKNASRVLFPQSVYGDYFSDKTTVTYNFNLGVQRDLGFGTTLDVSYVGALARHLLQTQNRNAIPFGADFLASSKDPTTGGVLPSVLLRPIPGFGDIKMQQNNGTSNYNSLQVTASRREGKWISYGVNYTWSKALDFGSGDNSTLSALVPIRFWNYAEADFDQTHALKANWLSTLPQSPWQNVVAKTVLSDWRLSGSAFFLSGVPTNPSFSTTIPLDISGSPTDPARINMTGNPNLAKGNRTFNNAFQTSVFGLPAVGTYGTVRRNPLRQPGSQTWNLAFLKNFKFTERINLEVRAEMYNAFNHANFSMFNTSAIFNTSGTPATNPNWGQQTNPGFGQYTATLDPRKMQLGARFSF